VFLHASTTAEPSHHSSPQLNVVSFTRDLSLESPFPIQARSIHLRRRSHPPMRHTTIFLILSTLHRLSPCLNPLPTCHPRVWHVAPSLQARSTCLCHPRSTLPPSSASPLSTTCLHVTVQSQRTAHELVFRGSCPCALYFGVWTTLCSHQIIF
jgi:hypothetical protein